MIKLNPYPKNKKEIRLKIENSKNSKNIRRKETIYKKP